MKNLASFSLTSWVKNVLPNDFLLMIMIDRYNADQLPPLGSYYDFMHRFWDALRTGYARSSLLPAGKNVKKPKKVIGPNWNLAEPELDAHSTVVLKDRRINGGQISNNPERFLEDFFLPGCRDPFH